MTIKEMEKELLNEKEHCEKILRGDLIPFDTKKEYRGKLKLAVHLLYMINPTKYKGLKQQIYLY